MEALLENTTLNFTLTSLDDMKASILKFRVEVFTVANFIDKNCIFNNILFILSLDYSKKLSFSKLLIVHTFFFF